MSPWSQPMVREINSQEICSPKVADLMMGCWERDIRGIVYDMRWVKASWWDLSTVLRFPLSLLRSTNHISRHYRVLLIQPTRRSKDPLWHQYRLNCSLSWFSRLPMLTNPCSMFSIFLCHDHILLHLHFVIMTILLTVSPTLGPLLTHSLLIFIFSYLVHA